MADLNFSRGPKSDWKYFHVGTQFAPKFLPRWVLNWWSIASNLLMCFSFVFSNTSATEDILLSSEEYSDTQADFNK